MILVSHSRQWASQINLSIRSLSTSSSIVYCCSRANLLFFCQIGWWSGPYEQWYQKIDLAYWCWPDEDVLIGLQKFHQSIPEVWHQLYPNLNSPTQIISEWDYDKLFGRLPSSLLWFFPMVFNWQSLHWSFFLMVAKKHCWISIWSPWISLTIFWVRNLTCRTITHNAFNTDHPTIAL